MPRWKYVTLGSGIIAALSIGGAVIKARYFPAAHSVDLSPLGPIVLGIFALALLWTGALISWLAETLRRDRDEQERSLGSFRRHS